MGISTGSGGDGFLAEINVTPFVDVMLVLLIIFMVAAPLLTVASGARSRFPKALRPLVGRAREGQSPSRCH